MASALPLFPLPVVLLPGADLPLHIFEPRYRQLLDDVLARDQRFGIALALTAELPPPGRIGCTAAIAALERRADGRADLRVTGQERFIVRGYAETPVPYPVALVEPWRDKPADVRPERMDRLRDAFGCWLAAAACGMVLPLSDDPSTASFQVAAAVNFDLETRQRLLECPSAAERIGQILARLPALADEEERAVAVRTAAAGNGRGGPHQRIVGQ